MRNTAIGVLVLTAALGCTSSDVTPKPDEVTSTGVGGTGGQHPAGGAGGNGTGGGGGSPMGAPPETKTSPCNVTVGNAAYAEADFPGKTVADLRFARAEAKIINAAAIGWPPWATHLHSGTVYAADGKLAFSCGGVANPTFSEVTFIVPAPVPMISTPASSRSPPHTNPDHRIPAVVLLARAGSIKPPHAVAARVRERDAR